MIFNDGNNIFNGGTSSGNTVLSSTGRALINLNDAAGGDVAVLMAGNSTVNAFGATDVVYTSAALASTTGTIFGSMGLLDVVADASATPLALMVIGGTGNTDIFAGAASNIVLENTAGSAVFVAGAGNETLNGGDALGGFAFFGDMVAADAGSINLTIIGGQGRDFFSTGYGNETIFAGNGGAHMHINDLGQGTRITIDNLASSDFVNFAGLSVPQEKALLRHESAVTGGNLAVNLPNGTQVEFANVTSFTRNLT